MRPRCPNCPNGEFCGLGCTALELEPVAGEEELLAELLAEPPSLPPELAAILDEKCIVCGRAERAPRSYACAGCISAGTTSSTQRRSTR